MARVALDPVTRHASTAGGFALASLGGGQRAALVESMAALEEGIGKAAEGDLTLASRLLAAQAVSLDTLFAELVRRSALNMGQYPDATERYMRLALKAQSNCRATLARLHQPREQTVKHVLVNQGAQAVVADGDELRLTRQFLTPVDRASRIKHKIKMRLIDRKPRRMGPPAKAKRDEVGDLRALR